MKKNQLEKLKFGKGNSKLSKGIHTFSLPAGHSCPFAFECEAKADKETGKIKDGKNQQYRCFAASDEALRPTVRRSRWHNFDLLKKKRTVDSMANLIMNSMPKKLSMARVHVSGDFFSQNYFDAWMKVAAMNPDKRFYAYTKSIPYWVKRKDSIPDNFELTSSIGGREDKMIDLNKFKSAKVVLSEEEANYLGLEVDHDDSHAYDGKKNFALLIHGTQRAGSKASSALSSLRKKGIKGYSKKK